MVHGLQIFVLNLGSILLVEINAFHGSVTWPSGSERHFYDHDRNVSGSTSNLVLLLRPWIYKMLYNDISAWCDLASSKLKKSEENSTDKLGNKGNS